MGSAESISREIASAVKLRQIENGFDPPPIRTFDVILPFVESLTAERDAANQRAEELRATITNLESENATQRATVERLKAERLEATRRAERAESKLRDLQTKCIETGWFDKPKEA